MEVREPSRGTAAEVRKAKELLPHIEIAPDALRGRTPAMREAPVGNECVRRAGEGDVIPIAPLKQGLEVGSGDIDGRIHERPIEHDEERSAVSEVGAVEQPSHLRDVIAQEEVIVREVADDPAGRSLQSLMSMKLPIALSLGEVEATNRASERNGSSAARVSSSTPSPTTNTSTAAPSWASALRSEYGMSAACRKVGMRMVASVIPLRRAPRLRPI